ncbi:MAG: hypothetical protein MI806_06430, partial [Minwuiales bacterium]|nr:hypothetical protein [Minwuiales bacterium]
MSVWNNPLATRLPRRSSAPLRARQTSVFQRQQSPEAVGPSTRDEMAVFDVVCASAVEGAPVGRAEIASRSGLAEDRVDLCLARLIESGSVKACRDSAG